MPYFICDLTTLSVNVLFELGYAIAKGKRISITLNSSFRDAKRNYKKLSVLSTIGYISYENSYELRDRFLDANPLESSQEPIREAMIRQVAETQTKIPGLFYLKSEIGTDASIKLTMRLQSSELPLIVDDPQEVASQPLIWYFENIHNAYAVVVHFIDQKREVDSTFLQNAKYSLGAGLARGLEKPLLMLAHAPFDSPVDFRDNLKIHQTAAECSKFAELWLEDIENRHDEESEQFRKRQTEVSTAIGLHRIRLGEYIAENEEQELSDYFVETASFNEALNVSQYLIYVGRKGSGKTANLYQLAKRLEEDKRNHVCIIKPVDYELEGVLRLLNSSLARVDPGYLIESLWKFLVYTELAVSVYSEIEQKPVYYQRTESENKFVEYVKSHQNLILSDFTVRMENAITELCSIDIQSSVSGQRAKISEILHTTLLGSMRELLGEVLENKKSVFVLVDNLDKAWSNKTDLDVLSEFLFGLLSAGQTISNDFQKPSTKWKSVNLSLVVFLRSDIFTYIMRVAREGDKVTFTRMDWNDPILLRRVIEERFANSLDTEATEEIWEDFFAETVRGVPTKDYIINHIIPRPRDIIFLCKNALSNAINHRNSTISKDDIIQAEKVYSEYALNSLLAETEIQFPDMERLLIEFVGADEIISKARIEELARAANIDGDSINEAIELLCENTFLGLEIDPGKFEFLYNTGKAKVLQKMAQRVSEQKGIQRFKINTSFHAYLEISSPPAN